MHQSPLKHTYARMSFCVCTQNDIRAHTHPDRLQITNLVICY